MTSLAVLAVPSMFSGFVFKDFFIGFGNFTFADSIILFPANAHFFESDFLPALWRIAPVITSFFLVFLVIVGFDFFSNSFFVNSFVVVQLNKYLRAPLQVLVDFFALN